jgi:diguanylate cyclase (GGDEF)-like protein
MPMGSRERLSLDEATLGRLRPVLEVVRKAGVEVRLRDALVRILDTMIEACNARRGCFLVFRDGKYKVKIARDRAGRDLGRAELRISRTVLKAARLGGRRVVCANIRTDPAFRLVDSVHALDLLSVLCLPLRVAGKTAGVFYLDNAEIIGAFGPRQVEVAEILAEHAAIAVEKDLLRRQSSLDRLTKLYNHAAFRRRLERELERARREGRRFGVLMLDLDDFKSINDTYGHDAGNEVLRHVARALAGTVRASDLVARPTVARFGGDEFEILLPGAGREGALGTARRLVAALGGAAVPWNGRSLRVSVSVGGAVFPDDASGAAELLRRADEALYASKRSGKNRAVMYGWA